jgi:uncharacterized protein (TIGR03083 family)
MSAIMEAAIAYGRSLQSLLTLAEQLDEADWAAPTQCPLWSVADIYAHIIGPEVWFAGGAPAYDVTTQQFIDSHVAERRGRRPAELVAELRDVLVVRRKQLDEADKQPTVFIPRLRAYGPHELGLRMRLFDLWTHEQDVRVAVSRPGGLDTDSARLAQDLLIQSLPRSIAKVAAAPPGSRVRITILGEQPADVAVAVDDAGRGALIPAPDDAGLHLTMAWETFGRLCAGRGAVSDYDVDISGDPGLAQRVLTALNIAP